MRIYSVIFLFVIILAFCSAELYPTEEEIQQTVRFTKRTEIAQKACAIPGPRGFRGLRGVPGDKGPTGPRGLPGLLGAQVEVIETGYNPFYQNKDISILGVSKASILNSTALGVLISRSNYQVKVLATAIVQIDLTCARDINNNNACAAGVLTSYPNPLYLEAAFTVTQVITSGESTTTNPTVNIGATTISVPINGLTIASGGATGNVFLQHYENIDASETANSQFYLTVTLGISTSNTVPINNGFVFTVSGNLATSIYYQDVLAASPSPSPI